MKMYIVSVNNPRNPNRVFKFVFLNALNRFEGMRINASCYDKLGADRARVSYDDWDPLPHTMRSRPVESLSDVHTNAYAFAKHATDYYGEGEYSYTLEEANDALRAWFNTWGMPFTQRLYTGIYHCMPYNRKRDKLSSLVNAMEIRYRRLCGDPVQWSIEYKHARYRSEYGFKSAKNFCTEMGRLIAESLKEGEDLFSEPFMEDYDVSSGLHNRIAQYAHAALADKIDFSLTEFYCDHWGERDTGGEVNIGNGRYRTYCECCVGDSDVVVETYDTGILMLREAAYWHDSSEEYYEHEQYDDDSDSDSDDDDSERNPNRLMSYSTNVLSLLDKDESFKTTAFGEFHMGVELELATSGYTYDAVSDLRQQLGSEYMICKQDGSLPDGGVEIVTAPRGLAEHISKFKAWTVDSKYRAWNTGKCGMHVHIDSRAFTRLTLGKFLMFINTEKNAEFIRKIAGRHPHVDVQAQSYCAAEGQDVLENPSKALKGKSSNRYYMVNTTCLRPSEAARLGVPYVGERNFNTIELRIFRASLKKERLLAQIEFTHAVIMFCRIASMRDLDGVSFLKWLKATDNRYPHLSDWYGIRRRVGAKNSAPAEITCSDVTPARISV